MNLDEQQRETLRNALHERARDASTEQRRLLISLGTASLGVFFIAVTTRIEPPLSRLQLELLLGGAIAMATTVLSGLLAWQADAQRNYLWARALAVESEDARRPIYVKRNRWVR